MRCVGVARDDREAINSKVHLVEEAEANRYNRRPEGHTRRRYMVHAICTRGVAFPVFQDWTVVPEDQRCQACASRAR